MSVRQQTKPSNYYSGGWQAEVAIAACFLLCCGFAVTIAWFLA